MRRTGLIRASTRPVTATVDEVIAMISGDAEAADQALTFLALEGRIRKIHQRGGSSWMAARGSSPVGSETFVRG
ncbi:hypothetical protein DEH69_30305 [Streptomyces sp. PT12]|nr:hypothetical protein DEH69_30305 [Streptomyces sp. PT12]